MKLTKERKVYLALLGLGGAAFVGDRLFFEPADARAASTAQDCIVSHEAAAEAVPTGAPAPAGPTFAERIDALQPAPSQPLSRDLFQPPASWPVPAVEAQVDGPPLPDFDEFLSSHRVSSVVEGGQGRQGAASINGRICRTNDNVDGFTLSAITSTGVEFRSPAGDVRSVTVAPAGRRAAASKESPASPAAPAR